MNQENIMKKRYYRVLSIAGSDSGGGAGIQADLKTFSALGCYGMTVITALTAQNTKGVTAIHAVPVDFVRAQMDAVLSDIGVDAVKIGMLFSPELIESVASKLKEYKIETIVLDPVMAAQSGDRLVQDDAIDAIRNILTPLAMIVTPNLPEAELLIGRPIKTMSEMYDACPALVKMGAPNILIKGGHMNEKNSTDLLYLSDKDQYIEFNHKRIKTLNNHGTGCTLSSATASFLAQGDDMKNAVAKAKIFISEAIQKGSEYKLGNGHGPVYHFFNFWE